MKGLWAALLIGLLATNVFAQGTAGDGQPLVPQPSRGTGSPKGSPVGGMNASDSTFKMFRLNSSGGLTVAEASPIFDQNGTFESIISNASMTVNLADSSQVIDTHALRHLTLLIKAVPAGGLDTSSVVRLIFQVRTNLNGQTDSSSIFAHYPYGSTAMGVGVGAGPDSFTTGHLIKGGGVPGAALGAIAWSGEFVVQIMGVRKAHASAVTTLGHLFYYPSGVAISLDSVMGREFWSPYTSIRVRNGSNQTCGVTVHLVGSPL